MSALLRHIDRFGALCGAACTGVTTALDMAATGGALARMVRRQRARGEGAGGAVGRRFRCAFR